MDDKMQPITWEDFVLQRYEWTKVSRYAVTLDGILVRDDSKPDSPFYMCLWEGWWEPQGLPAVGVSIRDVLEAKPVSTEEAREIIRREAKPRVMRPAERKNWRFD
ncbi:MAG: hypothetical protein PHC54_02510 [Candidatus Omnitrophica bacterium]|nr:hypothetical protein [Candidatus Omnitrophota bacterium]MDD5592254.1 hypothetical protein [Candidatus Omnitrophota bacterium]